MPCKVYAEMFNKMRIWHRLWVEERKREETNKKMNGKLDGKYSTQARIVN